MKERTEKSLNLRELELINLAKEAQLALMKYRKEVRLLKEDHPSSVIGSLYCSDIYKTDVNIKKTDQAVKVFLRIDDILTRDIRAIKRG